MKVLLVNDASGVQANLKEGLIELGHSAKLAMASFDRQSRGKAELELISNDASRFNRLRKIISIYIKVVNMKEFDVINYVNTLTAFRNNITRYYDLKLLKNNGARLSYYGVGCDEAGLLRVRSDVKELPCKSCIQYDDLGKGCASTTLSLRPLASKYSDYFDYSISSAYVFSHCHDFFPMARHASIPFPIVVSSLPFHPARDQAKPIIVHSPTRRGFKGTDVVLKAISILREQRSDFEFRLIENLSYDDYISTMQECDVYVDQVHSSDAHGVAALENLARGKMVISGNGEKNWMEFPESKNAPIFQASPDPKVLAVVLSDLLDQKRRFPELAEAGRDFVAKSHDHVAIAKRFVELWQQ